MDTLHLTHPRASYHPIITTKHYLFIVQPRFSSSAPLLSYSPLVMFYPTPWKLPVTWCCPLSFCRSCPVRCNSHWRRGATLLSSEVHLLLLSIFAYISFVAIDLCLALALSIAVVIRCAIHTLTRGHQFPRYLTLWLDARPMSWFLLSCITLPIRLPFYPWHYPCYGHA